MTARADVKDAVTLLPPPFAGWFASRGWTPRPHQVELLAKARAGRSVLLIAPTGAGKTLAGFLPTLVSLHERPKEAPVGGRGPHTVYISPLKALAVDIARNLEQPVAEMGLPVTMETRTGDTPLHKRQRQKLKPPDILLTTPEQLALLISATDAGRFFADVDTVILDELHSLVVSKRGDLLSLGLARLRTLAPGLKAIGLSATVAEPDQLRGWLVGQSLSPAHPRESGNPEVPSLASEGKPLGPRLRGDERPEGKPPTAGRKSRPRRLSRADLITVAGGAKPEITILDSQERVPWSGHAARYALADIYATIAAHRMVLIFVNTRSQAEMIFQELWRINADALPIALHHGSLDPTQRRKVEAAMAAGKLRAVVATSTLDLGIDWGDVDLVIHVGAPKGASRLAQRIGRANHRLDEPSKALLVPANRFEVLECRAALDANYLGAQDTPPIRDGGLDVLAQHVLGMACAAPFDAGDAYREVTSAYPYRNLARDTFDRVVAFVATGGYALKTYERYAKIRQGPDGLWRVSHPRFAQQYRLNVGTIIEAPMLNVRVGRSARAGFAGRGGRTLGKIEEYFIEQLSPGETFLFAGQVLRFEGIRENEAIATRTADDTPKIPMYAGGKFPLTTYLATGVRAMLADPKTWANLPVQVSDWLKIQRRRSILPKRNQLLVETFPRGNRFYLVSYPFEGRLAHQTLGMLLTRRLERARLRPTGFVATDYSLAVWGLGNLGLAFARGKPSLAELFDEDMLGDDLDAWMADSYLLKRTFRSCALISGLIEKRHPGKEKTGRQMTVSSDLIYDVLRAHEPDHILMQATWADAATGQLDVARLGEMLSRIKGKIVHKQLDRISPLALPVMLEIGREVIAGEAQEDVLREAAEDLINEAMGDG
ncbi:MAG: ligase-associated DNA damage response DEXH box helicase [Bauldia sp.]|uniref:ligase-associated DNA damage response DEXH box helicase n=1 Tax=Bauldia sp. TaxID=2575872 RepID=UPI001DD26EEC|nr:ligase-associated DNA damage response DEXH box helicase [Bauldia sp.]MCB1494694.1 ligase-associated DNA damage response DEXH box helicase [Bauldia sp.]